MSRERHEAAKQLFLELCELPAGERRARLEGACGGDDRLRGEVLELLSFDEIDDDLKDEALQAARTAMESTLAAAMSAASPPPERIGRYRIIRLIGQGGMGAVYEAEQESPRRTVALKLIRPGFASPDLMRRFRHEADVLARLAHPGIAHIYEAGLAEIVAPDGGAARQPFFAMELVRGEPLLDFVRARRLGARARLLLIARVADAVYHAHLKGVIHRDLKPANILVARIDGDDAPQRDSSTDTPSTFNRLADAEIGGAPKVLDFGVARLTDRDAYATLCTYAGQVLGTLPYMSPEQVSGDAELLDTRSDVYSLGVILFEALAGRPPYEINRLPLVEAARVIREHEAPRLSRIGRLESGDRVDRDIETIVAKALEKDRERRYQSAGELAADLRRYLRDEPISARPATALYQLRKFARRNRGLVVGVACTLAALLLGLTSTTILALRQTQLRRDADRSAAAALVESYRANIGAAQAGLRTRNVELARAALAAAPEALRRWEWGNLKWRADRSELLFELESAPQSAALSPDRRTLLSAHGTVVIATDIESGAQRWRLDVGRRIFFACMSRDGSLLAVESHIPDAHAGREGADIDTSIWDLARGTQLWRAAGFRYARPTVFSADGRWTVGWDMVATAAIRDARTGELIEQIPFDAAYFSTLTPHPIESCFAMAFDSDVRIFEVDLDRRPAARLLRVSPGAGSIAFAGDGARYVRLSPHAAGLTVVDAATDQPVWRYADASAVHPAVDVSPDGRLAASVDADHVLRVIDTATGGVTCVETMPTARVCTLFTADGEHILIVDRASVRRINVRCGENPFTIPFDAQNAWASTCFALRANAIFCGGWGNIGRIDARTGRPVWGRTFSRRLYRRTACSPDGAVVALADDRGGMTAFTGEGHGPLWQAAFDGATIDALAVSADATRVIAAVRRVGLVALDARSGREVLRAALDGRNVTALGETDSAGLLLAGMDDGRAVRIDLAAGRIAREWAMSDHSIVSVASAASGGLAAVDGEGLVAIVPAGAHAARLALAAQGDRMTHCLFSPDGSRLLAFGENGHALIWDAATANLLLSEDALRSMRAAAFDEAGRALFVASGWGVVCNETGPPPGGWADRARVERAMRIVRERHRPSVLVDELIEALRAADELPAEVRDDAIEFVRARGDQFNQINSQAWGVARSAVLSPEDYARAERLAQRASALVPDDAGILNTVGAVKFRVGRHDEAIDVLKRSDATFVAAGRGPEPFNWLFIAMAEHARGRPDAAREALAMAERTLASGSRAQDRDYDVLLREARTLVGPR